MDKIMLMVTVYLREIINKFPVAEVCLRCYLNMILEILHNFC